MIFRKVLFIIVIITLSAGCTQNNAGNDFILSGESDNWYSELKVTDSNDLTELKLKTKYKNDRERFYINSK